MSLPLRGSFVLIGWGTLCSSLVVLEEFPLLLADYAVVLGFEDIPTLLDQLARGFVLVYPIGSELPAAACMAGLQFSGIYLVLTDVELLLLVYISNAFLFELLPFGTGAGLNLVYICWHGGLSLSEIALRGHFFIFWQALPLGTPLAIQACFFRMSPMETSPDLLLRMRANLQALLKLPRIMFIGMRPKDMPLVELQLMWLFVDLLRDIPLMLVVPIGGGGVRMALGLPLVVLEDLGVEPFVLVDGLTGDDGTGMVLGLFQFLHGLVTDVGGVELFVVQLGGFAGWDWECLAAIGWGGLILG